ncbi:MAG: hypothetical protein HC905_32190 [Bacteroidales bacterium]|nr:hypothetical protein [Bacteroidales bacterium]
MATAGHRLGSSLGIRFDFNNFILWKEKMSMTIDINLVRFSNYDINTFKDDFAYITYDNISYGNYIRNLEVDLKASALKIPVIFNYNFSKGKIRPYFGIGFLNMIMISQNKNFVFESYYKRFNHSIPPYSIGYTARTGSKFMTPTNNYYFVELSYENTQSLDIHNFYQFKTNSISFIAGYSF